VAPTVTLPALTVEILMTFNLAVDVEVDIEVDFVVDEQAAMIRVNTTINPIARRRPINRICFLLIVFFSFSIY
jgi:hypothetical protein